MKFLFKFILSVLVVYALAELMSGIQIDSWGAAVIFTVVFSLLNVTIKPILKVLTLPITCLTLGLFLLFINILIVKAADYLVDGIVVYGWQNALLFSLGMSLATSAIEFILKDPNDNNVTIITNKDL